jgi:hypothetical protein
MIKCQRRLVRNRGCIQFGVRTRLTKTWCSTILPKGYQKKAVHAAKEVGRKEFAKKLHTEDERGNVFRIAKQIANKNKDAVGCGSIKDTSGRIITDQERMKVVWHDYFEKLLNEEFDWDRNGLDNTQVVDCEPEEISVGEVRIAIKKMKLGKASGPSGIGAEMLKAAGEAGVLWVTDMCNAIVKEGKIPNDWTKSWMVCVYKGKGDALECGSYRGIKLLDQVMKVFESMMEMKLRSRVPLDDMQFGFRKGKSTTQAIFIVRQLQEKYLGKKEFGWLLWILKRLLTGYPERSYGGL